MSTEPTGPAVPGAAAAQPEPPTTIPPATAPSAEPNPFAPPSTALPAAAAPAEPNPFAPPVVLFPQPELIEAGAEPARKRRKLGTGTLFLVAVLAGPVLGGTVGYAIQAARPATPLPRIAAPKLSYPADRVDPAVVAAAAPQPLNIDGDLRELLLKRPDGTEEWKENAGDGGWMTTADTAESYGESQRIFKQLLANGFRRSAVVAWKAGDVEYRIRLVQYAPDSADNAITAANDYRAGNTKVGKLAGNPDSVVAVLDDPLHYADSTEKYYYGQVLARKGTVVMNVEVYAKNPVDRAQLEDLAKRQWERLA
ncbi:hypothetical protein AB0K51_23070 [Kitasatospora sp. NPDC049285]|uniref:hypothetical protein n=1 Tax=Kitasatospora sp. NPDC049285 TaxID=3157096 RepID=UPI0034286F1A